MIAILIDRLESLGSEFLSFKHVDGSLPYMWSDGYYIAGYERLKLYKTAQDYEEFRLSLDDVEQIERFKSMMYFAISKWKPIELQADE